MEDRTVQVIWETETGKMKRRGRPKRRWNEEVSDILNRKELSPSERLSQRKKYMDKN